MWRWSCPTDDSPIAVRSRLRGWITEIDQVVTLAPAACRSRSRFAALPRAGDAAETFAIAGGKATGASPTPAKRGRGGYYFPPVARDGQCAGRASSRGGRHGVTSAQRQGASMTIGPSLTIQGPERARRQASSPRLRGILASPAAIWLDEQATISRDVGYISTMPEGYEGALKAMRDVQEAATAGEGSCAQRFLTAAAQSARCCSTMSSCSMPTRVRSWPTRRC